MKMPPRAKGYARNGLPSDRSDPPFKAETAHRVPKNGQEAFSLSGKGPGSGRALPTQKRVKKRPSTIRARTRKVIQAMAIRARASRSPPWHRMSEQLITPCPRAMTAGRAFPGPRDEQEKAFLAGGGSAVTAKISGKVPSRTHSPPLSLVTEKAGFFGYEGFCCGCIGFTRSASIRRGPGYG
jgi:hypothetical protein